MPLEWKQESDLAIFIESQQYLRVATLSIIRDRFCQNDLIKLDHIIMAVRRIQKRVQPDHKHYFLFNEFLEFLHKLHRDLLSLAITQAFERVLLLQQWLFWLPSAMLGDGDTIGLAILAQFFTVCVALGYLFPELGWTYLGPLFESPIEELSRTVYERNAVAPSNPDVQQAMALMACQESLVLSLRSVRNGPHATYPDCSTHNSCPASSASLSSISDDSREGIRDYYQFLEQTLESLKVTVEGTGEES
jgi:hypothetical protein